MDYYEFLKADILCLLHDYGEMNAAVVNSILGAKLDDVENALAELVLEEKVKEVGTEKYLTVDEVQVKRLKKALPNIF